MACRDMSQEENRIDLETFLNVLDQEQLQSLIVQMIVKDPSNFDLLEDATTYLDHENLIQAIDELVDIDDLTELNTAAQKLHKRYEGYMTLTLHENALVVLYALSNQVIMNLIENGIKKGHELTEKIVSGLENDWKALCTVYIPNEATLAKIAKKKEEEKKQIEEEKAKEARKNKRVTKGQEALMNQYQIAANELDEERENKNGEESDEEEVEYKPNVEAPYTLMKIFETLAQWRQQLGVLGPVFDDALRVLKLRVIEQKEKREIPAPTPPPNALPAKTGEATKKRKTAPKGDSIKKVIKKVKK